MSEKSAIGSTWEDVQKELFTPEEIAESRERARTFDAYLAEKMKDPAFRRECEITKEE